MNPVSLTPRRSLYFFKASVASLLSVALVLDPIVFAAPALFSEKNTIETFKIPAKLGRIEESFQGQNGKTVIYLQDAHDSLEAQENIAKIIGRFVNRSGVKTVYEEGYEGPVPTDSYFGFIEDAKLRKKISYFFLDKLRIGGAEYAHINRKKDFRLIGADNIKLHLENIAKYQEAAKLQKGIREDLDSLYQKIRFLADRDFPKEMKEWLRLRERFESGELSLMDYLKRTAISVEHTAYDALPNLALLLAAEGSKEAAVLGQVKRIQAKELFREIDLMETLIAERLLQENRIRKIYKHYKELHLLKRLNEIRVTPAEYENARQTLAGLNTRGLADFIARETGSPVLFFREWEKSIQSAVRFYEIAHARDEAMATTMSEFMKNPAEETAVLVFGGFHKEKIKAFLQASGCSYLIVTPNLSGPDKIHQAYYKQLMSVGHHSFEFPAALARAARAATLFVRPSGRRELLAVYRSALNAAKLPEPVFVRQVERELSAIGFQPSAKNARSGVFAESRQLTADSRKVRSELRRPSEREDRSAVLREQEQGELRTTVTLEVNERSKGELIFIKIASLKKAAKVQALAERDESDRQLIKNNTALALRELKLDRPVRIEIEYVKGSSEIQKFLAEDAAADFLVANAGMVRSEEFQSYLSRRETAPVVLNVMNLFSFGRVSKFLAARSELRNLLDGDDEEEAANKLSPAELQKRVLSFRDLYTILDTEKIVKPLAAEVLRRAIFNRADIERAIAHSSFHGASTANLNPGQRARLLNETEAYYRDLGEWMRGHEGAFKRAFQKMAPLTKEQLETIRAFNREYSQSDEIQSWVSSEFLKIQRPITKQIARALEDPSQAAAPQEDPVETLHWKWKFTVADAVFLNGIPVSELQFRAALLSDLFSKSPESKNHFFNPLDHPRILKLEPTMDRIERLESAARRDQFGEALKTELKSEGIEIKQELLQPAEDPTGDMLWTNAVREIRREKVKKGIVETARPTVQEVKNLMDWLLTEDAPMPESPIARRIILSPQDRPERGYIVPFKHEGEKIRAYLPIEKIFWRYSKNNRRFFWLKPFFLGGKKFLTLHLTPDGPAVGRALWNRREAKFEAYEGPVLSEAEVRYVRRRMTAWAYQANDHSRVRLKVRVGKQGVQRKIPLIRVPGGFGRAKYATIYNPNLIPGEKVEVELIPVAGEKRVVIHVPEAEIGGKTRAAFKIVRYFDPELEALLRPDDELVARFSRWNEEVLEPLPMMAETDGVGRLLLGDELGRSPVKIYLGQAQVKKTGRRVFVAFSADQDENKHVKVYALNQKGLPSEILWEGQYDEIQNRMIRSADFEARELLREERYRVQMDAWRLEYTDHANRPDLPSASEREIKPWETQAFDKDDARATQTLLAALIADPQFDWKRAKEENYLPDMAGRKLGVTDANGGIELRVFENFRFRWRTIGFQEAGWRAVIKSAGVTENNVYQFRVEFTKEGRDPIEAIYQIDSETFLLRGEKSQRRRKRQILAIKTVEIRSPKTYDLNPDQRIVTSDERLMRILNRIRSGEDIPQEDQKLTPREILDKGVIPLFGVKDRNRPQEQAQSINLGVHGSFAGKQAIPVVVRTGRPEDKEYSIALIVRGARSRHLFVYSSYVFARGGRIVIGERERSNLQASGKIPVSSLPKQIFSPLVVELLYGMTQGSIPQKLQEFTGADLEKLGFAKGLKSIYFWKPDVHINLPKNIPLKELKLRFEPVPEYAPDAWAASLWIAEKTKIVKGERVLIRPALPLKNIVLYGNGALVSQRPFPSVPLEFQHVTGALPEVHRLFKKKKEGKKASGERREPRFITRDLISAHWMRFWLANGGPAPQEVKFKFRGGADAFNLKLESKDLKILLSEDFRQGVTKRSWVHFPSRGEDSRGLLYTNLQTGARKAFVLYENRGFLMPLEVPAESAARSENRQGSRKVAVSGSPETDARSENRQGSRKVAVSGSPETDARSELRRPSEGKDRSAVLREQEQSELRERQVPTHVIRAEDDAVWNSIMKRINFIQANMVYLASKQKREVKVGGHQSAAASMKEILMAAWVAMHDHDYAAAKPHSQPADIAIQYLLGKLHPDGEISQQILRQFRNATVPDLNNELFAEIAKLNPATADVAFKLIQPMLEQQDKAPQGPVSGIPAYPRPDGPGRETVPMGSVGLGASTTVALAILHKYLVKHGADVPEDSHFWALIGDGETDEGNALEMLNAAVEFEAHNVTHVIDYNRQSLDGNRGMFHYDELKHRYARWEIIELKWGRKIEAAFARENGEFFRAAMEQLTNAEYQALLALGAKSSENFALELKELLVSKISGSKESLTSFLDSYSGTELFSLFTDLGGHDLVKLSEAMARARANQDKPVAIIAWTIKGHGLPAMMGNPMNHSQLLTAQQMEELRVASGIPASEDFPVFDPASEEGKMLAGIRRQIDRQEKTNAARIERNRSAAAAKLPQEFPKRFPLAPSAGYFPTQLALNEIIGKLHEIAEADIENIEPELRAWKPFADALAVISPDVISSTLPSAAKSIFGKPLTGSEHQFLQRLHQKYGLVLDRGVEQSWTGRNIEAGLAEMKAVNLAIAFAMSPLFFGASVYPVMSAYDMFIFRRALDIWFFGQYWGSPIVAIGTPSGSGLAPEGGLHQSIMSLIIALMMPNTIAYEPAFIDELEYIFPEIMRRMMTGDTQDRAISYLRGSTVPVRRSMLWERLKRQKDYAGVPDMNTARDLWGEEVLRGGYALVNFRGYSREDRLIYMKEVLKSNDDPKLHLLELDDYNPLLNVVHILASGPSVNEAVAASDQLLKAGIYANVIVVTSPSLLAGRLGKNIQDPDYLRSLAPRDETDYPHLRRLIPLEERAFAPMVGVADGSSLHHALAASRLGMASGFVDLGIEKNGRSVRSVEEIWAYHGIASQNIVTQAVSMLENRDIAKGTAGQILPAGRSELRNDQSAVRLDVTENLDTTVSMTGYLYDWPFFELKNSKPTHEEFLNALQEMIRKMGWDRSNQYRVEARLWKDPDGHIKDKVPALIVTPLYTLRDHTKNHHVLGEEQYPFEDLGSVSGIEQSFDSVVRTISQHSGPIIVRANSFHNELLLNRSKISFGRNAETKAMLRSIADALSQYLDIPISFQVSEFEKLALSPEAYAKKLIEVLGRNRIAAIDISRSELRGIAEKQLMRYLRGVIDNVSGDDPRITVFYNGEQIRTIQKSKFTDLRLTAILDQIEQGYPDRSGFYEIGTRGAKIDIRDVPAPRSELRTDLPGFVESDYAPHRITNVLVEKAGQDFYLLEAEDEERQHKAIIPFWGEQLAYLAKEVGFVESLEGAENVRRMMEPLTVYIHRSLFSDAYERNEYGVATFYNNNSVLFSSPSGVLISSAMDIGPLPSVQRFIPVRTFQNFQEEKDFYRFRSRSSRIFGWGVAQVERVMQPAYEELMRVPFLYSAAWAHSGAPSDHEMFGWSFFSNSPEFLSAQEALKTSDAPDWYRGLATDHVRTYADRDHAGYLALRIDENDPRAAEFVQEVTSLGDVDVIDLPKSSDDVKVLRVLVPEAMISHKNKEEYEAFIRSKWDAIKNAGSKFIRSELRLSADALRQEKPFGTGLASPKLSEAKSKGGRSELRSKKDESELMKTKDERIAQVRQELKSVLYVSLEMVTAHEAKKLKAGELTPENILDENTILRVLKEEGYKKVRGKDEYQRQSRSELRMDAATIAIAIGTAAAAGYAVYYVRSVYKRLMIPGYQDHKAIANALLKEFREEAAEKAKRQQIVNTAQRISQKYRKELKAAASEEMVFDFAQVSALLGGRADEIFKTRQANPQSPLTADFDRRLAKAQDKALKAAGISFEERLRAWPKNVPRPWFWPREKSKEKITKKEPATRREPQTQRPQTQTKIEPQKAEPAPPVETVPAAPEISEAERQRNFSEAATELETSYFDGGELARQAERYLQMAPDRNAKQIKGFETQFENKVDGMIRALSAKYLLTPEQQKNLTGYRAAFVEDLRAKILELKKAQVEARKAERARQIAESEALEISEAPLEAIEPPAALQPEIPAVQEAILQEAEPVRTEMLETSAAPASEVLETPQTQEDEIRRRLDDSFENLKEVVGGKVLTLEPGEILEDEEVVSSLIVAIGNEIETAAIPDEEQNERMRAISIFLDEAQERLNARGRSELRVNSPEKITDARSVEFYKINRRLIRLFAAYKNAKDKKNRPGMDNILDVIQDSSDYLGLFLPEIRGIDALESQTLAALEQKTQAELKDLAVNLGRQIKAYDKKFIAAFLVNDQPLLETYNREVVRLAKERLKAQILRLRYELKQPDVIARQSPILTIVLSVVDIYRRISYEHFWRNLRARGQERISRFRMVDAAGSLVFNLYYERQPVIRVERGADGELRLHQIVWKNVPVPGGTEALQPVLTPMNFQDLDSALRSRIHVLASQEQDFTQLIYHDLALQDISRTLKVYEADPSQISQLMKDQALASLESVLEGPNGKNGLRKKIAQVRDPKKSGKMLPMPGESLEAAETLITAGSFKEAIGLIESARAWISARLTDIERKKNATVRKRDYAYLLIRHRELESALKTLDTRLAAQPLRNDALRKSLSRLEEVRQIHFGFIARESTYREFQYDLQGIIAALKTLIGAVPRASIKDISSGNIAGREGLAVKVERVLEKLDQMKREGMPAQKDFDFGEGNPGSRSELRSFWKRSGNEVTKQAVNFKNAVEHREMYEWLSAELPEQVGSEIVRSATLIHFDFHPDTHVGFDEPTNSPVTSGNVIAKTRQQGFTKNFWWVIPPGITDLGDYEWDLKFFSYITRLGKTLPPMQAPAILSIDYDFFASKEERAVTVEEIDRRMELFTTLLKASRYNIIGIFLAESPEYTLQSAHIKERLYQELAGLYDLQEGINIRSEMRRGIFDNKRALIDFNDLTSNFSDAQIEEIMFVAEKSGNNSAVHIYNVDSTQKLGKFLLSLKIKGLEVTSETLDQLAASDLRGFSGEVAHLSSRKSGMGADKLKRILDDAGIQASSVYSLAYQDEQSGTLGVGLKDIEEGKLKNQLPEYMAIDSRGRIYLSDPSVAGAWQALYQSSLAFSRAA